MKKTIATLLISLSIFATKAQTWTLDNAHSSVNFAITHMVVSETAGNFKKFSADVTATKADFTDLKVNFTIETASVNTDNEKRDEHLRGDDFFNAPKYPAITFTSTKTVLKGNNLTLTGNLTMHGKTKAVTFTGKYNGTIKDPYGLNRAGFKLKTVLKRSDFDLTWNKTLDQGGLALGDEVTVTVNIEVTKK